METLEHELHECAMVGDLKRIKDLINSLTDKTHLPLKKTNKVAYIESPAEYKHTLLMTAIIYNQIDVVEYLIQQGANIEAKTNLGDTPLLLAVHNNKHYCMEYLIKHKANVNARNNKQETPLHIAAQQGNCDGVSLLIKQGADINAKNKGGQTPLEYAIREGHKKIVQLLVETGKVNIEAKDKWDRTPFCLATSLGDIPIMTYLLQKGSNIDTLDDDKASPLFSAIIEEKQEVIQFLIDHGANIHIKSKSGMNILHLAAHVTTNVLEYLLSLDIDIESKDNQGCTPLMYATEIPSNIKVLLEHGAQIEATNNTGKTALMFANSSLASTQILIENNANINLQDKNGNTPLMHAIDAVNEKYEAEKVALYLIQQGADVTIKNKKGQTAEEWALKNIPEEVWRQKNKNISPNELTRLQQHNPELLEKLLVTGILLKGLKKQPYEQQLKIYNIAKKILSSEARKEFEQSIRMKRMNKKENQ